MVVSLDELSKQVQGIIVSYKNEIKTMWAEIETNVLTLQLIIPGFTLDNLKAMYPSLTERILKHKPDERKKYVIRKRDVIVRRELKMLLRNCEN